jgi:hypothetical protein
MATWDKDQPAGTLKVREADDYIRANNDALEDALNREHTFPGTYGSTAGNHVLGGVGVVLADTKTNLGSGSGIKGSIHYATDEKVIYRDTGSSLSAITAFSIPAGTIMYFYKNTAPTGWTIYSSVTDKVLAVKGGTGSYNVSGGNIAGTWTQPDHTLTITETPAHTHSQVCDGRGGPSNFYGAFSGDPAAYMYEGKATGSTGGGGAHNHGTTYRPYAAVGILATKDAY